MMKIRKSQDGSHTEEMVGLATWGVYDAINPPETISPDGRVPSVRYPNLRFEFPRLQVTVHTDSLALAQDQDSQARDWIVAMGKGIAPRETKPNIDLLITPARSSQGAEWSSSLALATYDIERIPAANRSLYQLSLKPTWEQMRQPEEPEAPMIDFIIHQRMQRHLFVTLDKTLLKLAMLPIPEGSVFVLTPCEAQRYIDLCLKAHGRYHINTNRTDNGSFYYWRRLWNLIPAFQKAWPYTVYASGALPHSKDIMDFMQALYARIIGQMQACDRIGWLRYGVPTSNARDEMLNQLNYFFMLATGVFDSLAWLAYYRFALQSGRQNITLRSEKSPGRENPFFRQLDSATLALASFLRDSHQQKRIALFYEPRDSIQHRLVLTGAYFNSGQVASDCNVAYLSQESAQAFLAIDRFPPEISPFSEWGLIRLTDGQILLEPYRFTCMTLRFLFPFVNEVLHHLDFSGWINAKPNIKADADTAIDHALNEHKIAFDVPYP